MKIYYIDLEYRWCNYCLQHVDSCGICGVVVHGRDHLTGMLALARVILRRRKEALSLYYLQRYDARTSMQWTRTT